MAFRGIQSTNIISTEVGFTDPLLILNKDGSSAVDVGFLGKIGATSYAGLVKDSSTDEFLLINSISLGSTSVNSVDATDLSLVKGNLTAGTVTATSFVGDGSALTNISGIVDWAQASAGTIHASNYTDTTYSVGDGGLTQNNFTNTLKNKLDTIETLADVTDTANVTSSGALMTTGGTMSGNLNMGANEIILADNGIIQMGTGDDFNIYHDGSDSIIKDKGTGNLALRTNGNFYVVNEASSEVLIRADVNGSVDLYYDNSKKIETTASGVTVSGTVSATAFTGDGSALTGISSGSSTLASLTDATVSSSDPTITANPSAVGHLWINSSSGESYVCTDATTNNNIWSNIGEGEGDLYGGWGGSASGGTTSTYGSYTMHTFTSSGTFTVTTGGPIDYLVVAGGGGGGSHIGGGGGAGGMLTATNYTISTGAHVISIGGGGSGSTHTNGVAGNGGNTSFGSIATAIGGGGGGSGYGTGAAGGSGGGEGHSTGASSGTPGQGTAGQGNNGGNGNQTGCHAAGGGGGKAAVGGDGAQGGPSGGGGGGELWNLDGNGYFYAGGGGGGGMCSAAGNGGEGGGGGGSAESSSGGTGGGTARNAGGNGASSTATAGNGGANTGGGGGGGAHGNGNGGAGGSGIVIIRYET